MMQAIPTTAFCQVHGHIIVILPLKRVIACESVHVSVFHVSSNARTEKMIVVGFCGAPKHAAGHYINHTECPLAVSRRSCVLR